MTQDSFKNNDLLVYPNLRAPSGVKKVDGQRALAPPIVGSNAWRSGSFAAAAWPDALRVGGGSTLRLQFRLLRAFSRVLLRSVASSLTDIH
jgi:hypothetical protein